MVIVGVPPLEFWVLAVLQDVLLALKVRVVVADPGSALHPDGVHPANTRPVRESRSFYCEKQQEVERDGVKVPVHEAAVLEVITVTSDLQLPAGETFPLVEGDLWRSAS